MNNIVSIGISDKKASDMIVLNPKNEIKEERNEINLQRQKFAGV